MIFCLSGCVSETTTDNGSVISEAESMESPQKISSDTAFSDRDSDSSYDSATAVSINLADNSTAASSGVAVNGNSVTITAEGTYILSGTLSDGTVIVDSAKQSKVQLVLSNADISSSSTASIYIKQADKVFVTTAEGSENTLSVKGEYVNCGEDNIDSVVFSKDDITFNGSGTLNINAAYGHGIVSKDELTITSGIYNITSASHGLSGKDCVCIADGVFNITSGKDAIHSENTEDSTFGYVFITDGTFNLTADGDGVSSSLYTQIDNGTFNITAGGGSENGTSGSNDMFGGPFGYSSSSDEDSVSAKGIKAADVLYITTGVFNIDSADDAIHSNSDAVISNGTFTVSSGDDGFHADSNLTINGGKITINDSYEGIEGHSIDINGGDIALNASDDGLNAAGGNDQSGMNGFSGREDMFASDDEAYIKITGGTLIADADGDGIDSNGALTVTGGAVYVAGPTNSGNGALDYAGNAEISGGIFIASGASGMASTFGSSSSQGNAMINLSSSQSETIELFDSNGNSLASFTPNKAYSCVVISCPEMEKGESYSLSCGSETKEFTLSSISYSESGMGSMGGGKPQGGMGGRPW